MSVPLRPPPGSRRSSMTRPGAHEEKRGSLFFVSPQWALLRHCSRRPTAVIAGGRGIVDAISSICCGWRWITLDGSMRLRFSSVVRLHCCYRPHSLIDKSRFRLNGLAVGLDAEWAREGVYNFNYTECMTLTTRGV